ncbi:hypothetical protein AB0F93_00005 [Micromonospora tulbaghiae]|uniref:hypothetical protein n=1 Tax=Micromonospora tulbaghiae TaxID=479978 RepID=UPI003326656A
MLEFVPVLVMLATAKKLVDVLRYAAGRDLNGVVTQLAAWAGGAVVVVAFAASDWATQIQLGDLSLSELSLVSQILAGLTVGSTASLTQDVIKAVDHQQTERKPALLDGGRHRTD